MSATMTMTLPPALMDLTVSEMQTKILRGGSSPVFSTVDMDGEGYFSARRQHYIPSPQSTQYAYLLFRMRLLLTIRTLSGTFEPAPSCIFPQLYLSDLYSATSPQTLDDLGITHILSISSPWTTHYMPFKTGERGRIKHLVLTMDDSDQNSKLLDVLPMTTSFISDALAPSPSRPAQYSSRPPNARVLVHCDLGKCPGAAVVLAFLISVQCMSLDAAWCFLRSRREIIEPSQRHLQELALWEEEVRRERENMLFRGLQDSLNSEEKE